jgi:hypothetical protein
VVSIRWVVRAFVRWKSRWTWLAAIASSTLAAFPPFGAFVEEARKLGELDRSALD